jgi:hypothetical protein
MSKMKNPKYYFIPFLMLLIFKTGSCMAQENQQNRMLTRDTTPVELLEYRLNKAEFMHYYGVDDTSRALINMFFRKRTNSIVNFCAPISGCLGVGILSNGELFDPYIFLYGGASLIFAAAGGVAIVYMIRGVVQKITYSRQTLLYILVDRERGVPVSPDLLDKLKPVDFYGHQY